MKARRVVGAAVRATLAGCAAAWLILWGVSLWYCHEAHVGHHGGTGGIGLTARLTPGALQLTGIRFVSEPGRAAEGMNGYYDVRRWADNPGLIRRPDWVTAGFGVRRWQQTVTAYGPAYTNYYLGASIPFWLLAVLCGVGPALHARRQRVRRRRRAGGLCLACGYDLRGTPEQCPECGTGVDPARRPVR